jgi:hypothetical protein
VAVSALLPLRRANQVPPDSGIPLFIGNDLEAGRRQMTGYWWGNRQAKLRQIAHWRMKGVALQALPRIFQTVVAQNRTQSAKVEKLERPN